VTDALRRAAGEAWAFRTRVERDAARRFARLADAIAAFDPESPVPDLLRRAAEDERRHTVLCAQLADAYGQPAGDADPEPAPIAPRALAPRAAALYEIVAACCVTESESVATLTTLLSEEAEPPVEAALREIAKDEVQHARIGWAHLAREATSCDVSFLAPYIPAMLAGAAPGLYSTEGPEDRALLRHGVLPPSLKRAVFAGALEEIVFPGLEKFGIDAGPGRAWLAERRAGG
jgi:hypothetical protein